MAEKKVYNEKDSDLMNKIKQAVEKHNELSRQVKSYDTRNKIIFYAFPSFPPNPNIDKTWQLWFENKRKNSITVTFHFCQCCDEYIHLNQYDIDLNEDTNGVLEFINKIKGKLDAFRNENQEWKTYGMEDFQKMNKNQSSKKRRQKQASGTKESKKAKLQNEPIDVEECIRKVLSNLRTEETETDFWKNKKVIANPWFSFELNNRGPFVLEADLTELENRNRGKEENSPYYIHLELPPQPYIGNPTSPIWLLLMNPSYSAADFYDMVCCDGDEIKTEILRSITYKSKETKKMERRYSDEDIPGMLPGFFTENGKKFRDKRKRLMQKQLKFDFSESEFYVLDEAFHTVRARGENQARRDETHQGSYEWWEDYLFSKNICGEKNLSKFFVLESFPYHSKSFDDSTRTNVEHFPFWVKMVKYALDKEKILLCRGEEIASMVSYIAKDRGLKEDRILVKRESKKQDFPIDYGSFIQYNATSKADEIIRRAMEQ